MNVSGIQLANLEMKPGLSNIELYSNPTIAQHHEMRARRLVIAGIENATLSQRERWRVEGKCVHCGDLKH